jgi:hypothetical protein
VISLLALGAAAGLPARAAVDQSAGCRGFSFDRLHTVAPVENGNDGVDQRRIL